MNLILFDHKAVWEQMLPLTFTRPLCELRTGVFTIREKWERLLQVSSSTSTTAYLSVKYPAKLEHENTFVAGNLLPDAALVEAVKALNMNEGIIHNGSLVAFKGNALPVGSLEGISDVGYKGEVQQINHPWDLFQQADEELRKDFDLVSFEGKPEHPHNTILGNQIKVHPEAQVNASTINTETGPVVIDKGAEVLEGCNLRGPLYIGENAVVKMGAKIYGATTLGPYSKVGGEITNSVILGYSNKGHDGFLGNSVLGEWCNLGADTNTSNLKNNYSTVRVWSYSNWDFVESGLQFCGLIMGDHSKCGINTMFNTGTVVGVSANVFGSGFPPKIIPSFSWGGADGLEDFKMDKAEEVASRMMERRDKPFDQVERDIFAAIRELSWKFRS